MILFNTIFLVLLAVPLLDATVYLYNTMDSSSVEFYDCIYHNHLFYCRRPKQPIPLNRDNDTIECHHGGQRYSFADLYRDNVNASTILHGWKSSMENADRYKRYIEGWHEKEGYLCHCTDDQTFGKNCEYRLPDGNTFADTFRWELSLKILNPKSSQRYDDVICYETFQCDSGLLCLDWRDICDGIQQCMGGIDEDMCDKLEFNECDDEEYRCRNGMCIPEEFFLDGEFDCLDWTDEIQFYNDDFCPISGVDAQCDDRFCPPMQYSCGDGQCVLPRFKTRYNFGTNNDCHSRREHYFYCETHSMKPMWTLPNGRCYESSDYEEVNVINRTQEERCEYILRCALSRGNEKNCPCGRNSSCFSQLNNICPTDLIQYPKGGIFAPYLLFFYDVTGTQISLEPYGFQINGTFKCQGNLIWPPWEWIHEAFCVWRNTNSKILNDTYYPRHPFTFNNHSYSLFDGCNQPRRPISTYRVSDGFRDCGNGADESENVSLLSYCNKTQRHRFRCSTDENKCLSAHLLGDNVDNCKNRFDEILFGANVKLTHVHCNDRGKDQCLLLRQYITNSWILNTTNEMVQQNRIPFRYFCDTFWNLGQREDENVDQCRRWWRCSEQQWQCDTGQCIEGVWVFDGEWDCADASDEDAPFDRQISLRNLEIISRDALEEKYANLLETFPLFAMCNETGEFHCLPVNLSHQISRPCISRNRIGDEHVDCYGAFDERQSLAHCTWSTILEDNSRCPASNQCIRYRIFCFSDECRTLSDEYFWCSDQSDRSDCNDTKSTVCFNGTCAKNGRCDRKIDCQFGEDEYMCDDRAAMWQNNPSYRETKQFSAKNMIQNIRLIPFPPNSNITKVDQDDNSTIQTNSMIKPPVTRNKTTRVAYWCNRGVGVYSYNESIVCFCPPQYYGDKCQYHSDRITVLIRLNLSQSIYNRNIDVNLVLKILVLFLFNNETLSSRIFQVQPATEESMYAKKSVHLLYSRLPQYLQHKQERSHNESSIIHDHPYSIRIELYQLSLNAKPLFLAVWQYPFYFDYFPVFRFAKVLHFIEPKACLSNPCHPNEDCHQLINDPSKHLCLCKSHFKGENGSIKDPHCHNGFCANGSICKPNYSGILSGNEFPLCICPFGRLGDQCYLEHDLCASKPCLNGGTCVPTSKPTSVACKCTDEYYGKFCEKNKSMMKLYFNQTLSHQAVVAQYFHINFVSLELALSYQQINRSLPSLIEYRHDDQTAPELILLKVYPTSIDISPEIYLLSAHINVKDISATVQLNEENQCSHVKTWSILQSPIQYHFLCENYTNLLCFRDDVYLCICEENHTRVECFVYDSQLDQCSQCSAGGRCLQADRKRPKDFLCLCPPCYLGKYCQFNSNSFGFTLDQLFLPDLQSTYQTRTIYLLIIIPSSFAFFALLNNLLAFITFRRPKCSNTGIGQCLLILSIINQLNLTILLARLIHLSLTITGVFSSPNFDDFLCKTLNYLLNSLMRIVYWLVSFIGTERVYTVIFLKGQWLNKTSVARWLIVFIIVIVGGSTGYELVFIRSFVFEDEMMKTMCVIDFPSYSRDRWIRIHQIVSITHSMLPLVINLVSTIIVIYVIARTKLNIRRPGQDNHDNEMVSQIGVENENEISQSKTKETPRRLHSIQRVLIDNKEILIRPAIALIPSIFSLLFFIISLTLHCQNIDQSNLRYLMIIFYLIAFVPQMITFLLYIYPSSFYFNEWRSTTFGRWFMSKQSSTTMNFSTQQVRSS